MKLILTAAGCLLALSSLRAQSVADKVAARTCDCLGQVTADSLQTRLRRCAPLAVARVLQEGTEADKQLLASVEGIQSTYQRLYQVLPAQCAAVGKLTAGGPLTPPEAEGKEKEAQYYRLSSSDEANKYYEAGNKLLRKKDYKPAIKQYEKAVAADPQFVFAWDNLAISHRRLEHFDQAREAYEKSLAIYPEGDVALLNMAVVYSLKQDWANARKYYALVQKYHPDSPEGYFGLGKLALLSEDHEAAMANLFKVHKMYVQAKSDYSADSEKLIAMLYVQMKQAGKTDLFASRAKEFGINVNVTVTEKP
jgi:tetratricopeptide (TPR) repeat protein